MTHRTALASACVLLLTVALAPGCGRQPLQSLWRDRQVAIDGHDLEWEGARFLVDQASVGFGVMNDRDYLYLTLSISAGSTQAQILRQGFTVWLDPKGGRNEAFGVHFPVSWHDGDDAWEPEQGRASPRRAHPQGGPRDLAEPELERAFTRACQAREAEVLGPGKGQTTRLSPSDTAGVLAALGFARGRLAYELRIPLARTYERPLGIGAGPGSRIGVGFETVEPTASQGFGPARGAGAGGGMGMPSRMDPGDAGGMPPGRGGGMGPGGAGAPPGTGAPETLAPFRLWVNVDLATQ